ncbi:unnamed protein product [Cylicostephanus goldi]|uniref:IFT140 first beta-propeller domain-containing protein n=1 Tax=Cylicostephanus goldi TaxID=71465 RepID=A0A3P6RG38_CYLGO|nr:unnamed protein product [Cylicostephanus goldi]
MFLNWSGDGKTLCAVMEDGKCELYALSGRSLKRSGEYNMGDKPTGACARISHVLPEKSLLDGDVDSLKTKNNLSSFEELGKMNGLTTPVQMPTAMKHSFVVSTEGGVLHLIEQDGTGTKLCQLDYRVEFVSHYHQKELLIALASDLMLYHFNILPDSTIKERLKVKLNGKPGSTVIVLKENLLLISHQERDLRVWNLETEENGTISLQSAKGYSADDAVLCMDYSKKKGTSIPNKI